MDIFSVVVEGDKNVMFVLITTIRYRTAPVPSKAARKHELNQRDAVQ
jgi:hypothetical protein